MIEEVAKGLRCWTIYPSDESVRNGEGEMVRPWPGIVTKLYQHGTVKICQYDTAGRPDDDSNASATAPRHLLFSSGKEAWESYRRWIQDQITGLHNELYHCDNELKRL